MQRIRAEKLAEMLGLKTGTLARWRWESRRTGVPRGPQGWEYLGETTVIYPADEVERYLASLGKRPKRDYRLPPSR